MFDRRRSRGLLIVPMLLWAAACSDTPNDPADGTQDAQLNLDVAYYMADQTIDDIAMMTHETDHVFGGPMLGPPGGGGMRGFGFDGNLSVTREVTFFDADGQPMDGYHAEDTHSIHIYFLLEGDRSRTTDGGSMSIEVRRERNMDVTGLEGTETQRIWNGTGSSSKEKSMVSDEMGDRSYEMSSTSITTGVVIPVPRAVDSWPLSGTIERIVHVEYEGPYATGTRDRTALITFNGTQLVPILINGVDEYTFDLATRRIVEEPSGG